MYENFWPKLHHALAKQHPEIGLKPNRLTHNYWTFKGPRVAGSYGDWVCSFPRSPSRLRVELFLGSEEQRHGTDVVALLRPHFKLLQATYGGPEDVQLEEWTTAAGRQSQRLAVYRSGTVQDAHEHPEQVAWFSDRLFRLQRAVDTLNPVLAGVAPGPDANSSYSVRSEAMTVADALEGVVEGLVAEPLFHLSLGSRELFHSNLLLWLCQQFPEAGSYVFRDLLEPDPAQRTFAVRREVRQLDLVIELPGFRPLVIENKVFSLPDESQLDRYARDNIVQEFGDRPVTRGLLSLVDPGWVDGTYGAPGAVWRRFSYRDLAQGIIEVMAEVGSTEPYAGQTLAHYASLLEHLTEFVELVIPRDDDEALALPKEWASLLKRARLHDTAQKVRGRFLVHMLSDAQSMLGFRRSTCSDGFAHGQSILECFTTLDDGDQIAWQLQGDQFRISGVFHSRKGRGPGATAERAAYAEQVHASWFQPDPALLGGRQLRPAESFNHFNPAFIYRYVRCVNLTVGELRELAIAVTSTAELHAREQARQDSVLGGAEDQLADGWWSAFEDDLTDRLGMAGHDDLVGVNAGPYYAQVMGVDGEFLHCELVANEFLSTEWHLDSSQEQAMQDRGWSSAGLNWSQDVRRAVARSVARRRS